MEKDRKFKLVLLVILSSIVMILMDKLTGAEWSGLVISSLGAYFTANVTQKNVKLQFNNNKDKVKEE